MSPPSDVRGGKAEVGRRAAPSAAGTGQEAAGACIPLIRERPGLGTRDGDGEAPDLGRGDVADERLAAKAVIRGVPMSA